MNEAVFLTGILIFILATIGINLIKKKSDLKSVNTLVYLTTLTSYALMYAGLMVMNSQGGDFIYPTRWLFYIGSCSLLMYEIGSLLNKSKMNKAEMIILNVFVMLAGFLASITTGINKWIFFIISSIAFIMILKIIYRKQAKESKFMKNIKLYVMLTWTIFPIIWIFSPADLELINSMTTQILYLALDVITKIIFGFYSVMKS